MCQVAIKILEKEKIKDHADLERINREITILKKVRHPNVVQLYDVSERLRTIAFSYFNLTNESSLNLCLSDDRKQRLSLPHHGVLLGGRALPAHRQESSIERAGGVQVVRIDSVRNRVYS